MIILAFVHRFPEDGNGYIGTNFGNQCDGSVYEGPGDEPSADQLQKDCNIFGMAEAIDTCQHVSEKKVMLALGGGAGGYTLFGEEQGNKLADQLWEMFGPKQQGYTGPRPLDGPTWSIDIDGFDFDIEYPSTDRSVGYIALAQRLRQHFAAVSTKRYYLSVSPQCVVPDANVGSLMAGVKFDMVFVQFYNTPYCSAGAWVDANTNYHPGAYPNPSQFSYDEWAEWIASSPSAGAKIMIGLPGATTAANPASYVAPDDMDKLIMAYYCRESFGGITIWEATHAYQNNAGGFSFFTNAKRSLGKAYREPLAYVCPAKHTEPTQQPWTTAPTVQTIAVPTTKISVGTPVSTMPVDNGDGGSGGSDTDINYGLIITNDGSCGVSMLTRQSTEVSPGKCLLFRLFHGADMIRGWNLETAKGTARRSSSNIEASSTPSRRRLSCNLTIPPCFSLCVRTLSDSEGSSPTLPVRSWEPKTPLSASYSRSRRSCDVPRRAEKAITTIPIQSLAAPPPHEEPYSSCLPSSTTPAPEKIAAETIIPTTTSPPPSRKRQPEAPAVPTSVAEEPPRCRTPITIAPPPPSLSPSAPHPSIALDLDSRLDVEPDFSSISTHTPKPAPAANMTSAPGGTITHIVLFKYSSSISWTDLESHFGVFRSLQRRCVHPLTGKPYMLSMRMGKNRSWESFSKGMTHAFVLEFASQGDLDYYLTEDPVHLGFSRDVAGRGLVEDSLVVDLREGELFGEEATKPDGASRGGGRGGARVYKGACHCGDCGFEVRVPEGEALGHVLCHCDTCKKISGAPFSCNYIVPREALAVTGGNGGMKTYTYQGASGKDVRCYYCGRCTSHVYHHQDAMPEKVIVRTLLLEEGKEMGVGGEIFKEGRLGWVEDLRGALRGGDTKGKKVTNGV
ncbi:hypothetical protein MKZ38_010787 [Zalerion maritima]|uniref:chitinase n=1 Tax=Zalerion maritima TaxID=339359 RepID=A0AAD5WVT3_9PEZI|nr:hypothetical protein MKZ38_010787 [Zalerion maritima]